MKKKAQKIKSDPITEGVSSLLQRIPSLGKPLARLYLWKAMLFNFMLVGASGTVLSWLLYEGIFRIVLIDLWGGTFLGMVITTLLVFLWNYSWNKHWSLNVDAQIGKMGRDQLRILRTKVEALLSEKFDAKGNRM